MRAERKRPARGSKPRRTPSRSPRRSPQARGASAVQAPPREFGSRNSEYGIGAHDSIPHSDFRIPHWEARVVIEGITPRIDGGRFPIKRTIGDDVIVEADIFTDGHDRIAAVLQYRASNSEWREAPMREIGNDRWRAQFSVETIGRCEYTIEDRKSVV